MVFVPVQLYSCTCTDIIMLIQDSEDSEGEYKQNRPFPKDNQAYGHDP